MRWRIFAALLVGGAAAANAAQYPLTDAEALMFGDIETITAYGEDTLPDLARRYGLGYEEILRANPGVDTWLPGEGTTIVIPGQRLLPPGPREGIVVNLPEHRLYYFPKPKKGETPQVITYPVSIGKMDWNTPLGKTRIVDKRKNPTWTPPESVRKEHAERGDPLPPVVKSGPDNPLGAVCHAPRHHARRVPHPRHEQSDCGGHGHHAWLHPHVSRGHRRRCSRWCR